MQLGDRTRRDHEQQESEDAGFHGEWPKRDLLRSENSSDGDHPTIENRKCEERHRNRGWSGLRLACREFDFGRHGREGVMGFRARASTCR
jgi:hypothetical protein